MTKKEKKRLCRLRWRKLHPEQWREEKRQYARRHYERTCRAAGKEPKPYKPVVLGTLNLAHKNEILPKYGITQEEFDALYEAQAGRCGICQKSLKKPWSEGTTHSHCANVDHCHETNLVRGLLCRACNVGLGHFKDDVWRLKKAIEYLNKVRPYVTAAKLGTI